MLIVMHVLTIVTPNPKKDFDVPIHSSCPDITIDHRVVLDDRAVNWFMDEPLSKKRMDSIRLTHQVDLFQQKENEREKKLFLADMDSTIVIGETLDDMAAKVGLGDKIAEITARAMRGEIDFEVALTERVEMLSGISTDIVAQCVAETRINMGADKLLKFLKARGIYCVLISGGFTEFTSVIADQLGFDAHFGNELIIDQGFLTGGVKRPILGKDFKKTKLDELSLSMKIVPHEVMAIGDGANDFPMLTAAGLGVAYYPKPLLKEALNNRIEYTDLSSLIYALDS